MFVVLFVKLMANHFIYEPRSKAQYVKDRIDRIKKDQEDFDKLYEMGASGCPVMKLRSCSVDMAKMVMD